MSVEKEASVRVRLTGEDDVAQGAKRVSSAWAEVGRGAGTAFREMGSIVSSAVQGVVSDIAHVVTAAGAINLASAVAEVDQLERGFARLGIAAGVNFGAVQRDVNSLSQDINELPQSTLAWTQSVGGLTYSYSRAAESARALKEYSLLTGEDFAGVGGLAVQLDQLGAGGSKAEHAIAVIAQQAKMLGRETKEVGDGMQHLQGQISQLAGGEANVGKISALVAGFGGSRGFTAAQRERTLGGVMSRVEGNAMGIEQFLGHSITDEFGHISDMSKTIKELQSYGKKGRGQERRLEFTFGKEGSAAIMHTDFAAIADAARAEGSSKGKDALDRMKESAPGIQQDQKIRKSIEMQADLGSQTELGKARRAMGEFSAEHPWLSYVGTAVGSTAASLGAKSLAGYFGGGGAATAAATGGGETAASLVGGGLLGAGALAAGAIGGTALATLATLHTLGEGSAVKEGFQDRTITRANAESMVANIADSRAKAEANMSPGMREALRLEQARKAGERIDADERAARAGQAPGPGGGAGVSRPAQNGIDAATIKALGDAVKAGQITPQQLQQALQAQPVQIEIVNTTDAAIDARVRGRQ